MKETDKTDYPYITFEGLIIEEERKRPGHDKAEKKDCRAKDKLEPQDPSLDCMRGVTIFSHKLGNCLLRPLAKTMVRIEIKEVTTP